MFCLPPDDQTLRLTLGDSDDEFNYLPYILISTSVGVLFACARWCLRSNSSSARPMPRRRQPPIQRHRRRANLNRLNGDNFATQSPSTVAVHNIREETPPSYEEATSTTMLLSKD